MSAAQNTPPHSNASGLPPELIEQVYSQLRAAASQKLIGERAGHTLQATALVHEALLKLSTPRNHPWQNRAQLYAAATEAMEQVLLDHAKSKRRQKRGAGRRRLDLETALTAGAGMLADSDESEDFLDLVDAIRRLGGYDRRAAEVVRLRFFAGLELEATAEVLSVSVGTVKNDWNLARAWLQRELSR